MDLCTGQFCGNLNGVCIRHARDFDSAAACGYRDYCVAQGAAQVDGGWSELPERLQRWCVYSHYARIILGFGDRARLPACLERAVRIWKPNPLGVSYTGYIGRDWDEDAGVDGAVVLDGGADTDDAATGDDETTTDGSDSDSDSDSDGQGSDHFIEEVN